MVRGWARSVRWSGTDLVARAARNSGRAGDPVVEEWLDPATREPTVQDLVLRRRHEAAYRFARAMAEDRRVIDVACGVGYGARVLGDEPADYVGVDRAQEPLRRARRRAPGGRIGFVCGDAAGHLPFQTGSGELVLAFQIVEHLSEEATGKLLKELRRICAPEGRVVITTPNRYHRLLPFQRPWNPYHTREFDRDELADLLDGIWREVVILGLRAEEEIERVERERVRQSPLAVYSRPLRRVLPESLRTWLERIARRAGNSRTETESGISPDQVTVDRFRVEEDPEGAGLDLVAVCRP